MNNLETSIFQGIEALENYLDPPKPTEGDEKTVDGIQPATSPPVAGEQPQPAQQPPQQIVWRKGKNGKDIHYDPAKDKVIFQLIAFR